MDFISKILFESKYGYSVNNFDYYSKVPYEKIRRKTQILASKVGVKDVHQAKTGTCYFVVYSPYNHFIFEVRIGDHPPSKKYKFYQIIQFSYFQSIEEMLDILKEQVYEGKPIPKSLA